jgi:predicted nucleic acid-binding protein
VRRYRIAPVFVDTNILIYSVDSADLKKQQAAQTWLAELWKSRKRRVSFQVLQEFYVKATQLRSSAREEARNITRELLAW